MPGSSLPPPRAVGAGAAAAAAAVAVVAAPQCGGGAGAGEDPGPGPRGPENAGVGAAGLRPRALRVGAPGVAPCSSTHPPAHTHTHADTLTHTHPRWAGADVSLKASHLHGEGRGLAEPVDRGARPQVPAPPVTPSFGAAGGLGPCPALTPAPLPQAALPSLPLCSDRAGKGPGPAPGLPQPPIAGARGPPAAKLHFAFLEPPFLGAPTPFPPPRLLFPPFSPSSPSSLLTLLQSQLSRCWRPPGVGSEGLSKPAPGGAPRGCTLTQDGVVHPAGQHRPAAGAGGRARAPGAPLAPSQTSRDRSLQEKSRPPCDPACPSLPCPETAISIPGGLVSLHVSPRAASG